MEKMQIEAIDEGGVCRLNFNGSLTFEFASELEDRIIDAMRCHDRFLVDLSGVVEIDLCGLHLLRVLQTLGGSNVQTIAGSPVVDQAERRLLATQRGNWLRRAGGERYTESGIAA